MNEQRILRGWGGLMLLLLGLALFPQGLQDSVLRAQGAQAGNVIAPALGALVGGVSLFFAVIILWRVGREFWVLKTGVPGRATITDAQRDSGGRWVFTYTYRDRHGVAHQDRVTMIREAWRNGDGAEVRYVADAPAESVIVVPAAATGRAPLPAVDTSLLDTPRVRAEPVATASTAKPLRASFKASIPILLGFAAIALLVALAAGALVLNHIWKDLIVQHGYLGTIELIGTWKVLLGLLMITAVVALPIFLSLGILSVFGTGFYVFVRHLLKK